MGKWAGSLAVTVTLLGGVTLQAQDGYKLVVNPANPIFSASKPQVSRFFLERAMWDDGQPVAAVDLPPTSPIREVFSRDVLGMPVSSVIARWRETLSLGRGDPPPSMATDREVLAYVRLKPAAIGYVSAATDTQGVKVIAVGKMGVTGLSQEPIEVGGPIPMPERIAGAHPVYPPAARSGRVEGEVDIEVVIGTTGNVERTRLVRSVPIFDATAVAAVRQWKYKPTIINGVAVSVKTIVRVVFNL